MMRHLAICLFTLLIGLPAFVFGVVFAEADSAANQAKAPACQANVVACQANAAACQAKAAACQIAAKACRAKTSACQVAATGCQTEANACACQPECRCDKTRAAHTRVLHLYQAAGKLRAAGLNTEAEHALSQMHALLRELLVDSVAERVQAEVERLRRTKGPQEKIVIRISSSTAEDNELGLDLNDDATRMVFICKPSHAIVHIAREVEGEHRRRLEVLKLMSWPDEEPEEEEVADAPKPTPAPTAQAPAATRK